MAYLIAFAIVLQTAPSTRGPDAFPPEWFGTWSGPCTTVSLSGKALEFTMELTIAPTRDPGRFKWEIVYIDAGKRQVRPYELVAIDAPNGRYVIDEKNSICIDSIFIDGGLYTQFEIGDVRVTGSYRLQNDRILLELMTSDLRKPAESGGMGQTPLVRAYTTRSVQRAVMTRQ
jgi:hypothetical protein